MLLDGSVRLTFKSTACLGHRVWQGWGWGWRCWYGWLNPHPRQQQCWFITH